MYTLGAAAKATGYTKSTILKAIQKGRITAPKDDLGRYQIDPAELHRVYPPLTALLPAPEKSEREVTQEITAENRELKARLEVIGQLLADIKEDRDHWRRQATALLTNQREAKPAPRPWWLWWLPV